MTLQNLRPVTSITRVAAMALGAVALLASNATAQTEVNLIAAPFTKAVTKPDGNVVNVPMWGFAVDENDNGSIDGTEAPTAPGPPIVVPPGDSMLTINLTNLLPEGVSIIIPGQQASGAPVRRGDGRIVSFAPESSASGGTASYVWNELKPGTYLYHSGSHPAVQVQMGLYGALTKDAAAGEAYAGVAYDNEVLLLHSEIDVVLHDAVDNGTYGTAGGLTSTIDYAPSLFLINGVSYTAASAPIPAGAAGERTLIRMLNAGLNSHVVVVDNASLSLVAEDGNRYNDARAQASILLPAGKTHDATWMPAASGEYTVYDRFLGLVANEQPSAGMQAKLAVAETGAPTIEALPDVFGLSEDPPGPVPFGNVLDNDTGATTAELYSLPLGTLTFNPDGTGTYLPPLDFSGFDSFLYRAVGPSGQSGPAQVTFSVAPTQDLPSAFPLTLGLTAGEAKPITLSGMDPDGDPLSFTVTSLPADGTLSYIDPVTSVRQNLTTVPAPIPGRTVIFASNAAYVGPPITFQFQAEDGFGASPAADVAITVHAAESSIATGEPITLNVVGSDGAPITEYRWTLEEDLTYDVIPGVEDPNTIAVRFHRSYMPVVGAGDESTPPLADPEKRYFVSVLPKGTDYSNGGALIARGQTEVTITLNALPMPTGQLTVFAFVDDSSLNGVYNNVEPPLPGIAVFLEDAGGFAFRAHRAANQITDFLGNPLGTTYKDCPEAVCETYEVDKLGDGFLLTDENGRATFKNLPPGQYEVFMVPPAGSNLVQGIQTFEGGKPIEAWVKANEPPYFYEFGPPGPHINIGFVQRTHNTNFLGAGDGPFSTITGQVTNLHMRRPPEYGFDSGAPFDFTRPFVALQVGGGEYGQVVYLQETDEEGNFEITGVPYGVYKLWLFDSAANFIPGAKRVSVNSPETPLGNVPIFQWYARMYMYVFDDVNQNGFRDPDERGIPEQATNLRFRDGSIYQSFPTDVNGFVPYEELFPFYNYFIAEVDFTRFRATGATIIVDDGGKVIDDGNPPPPANTNWPELVGAELDSRVLNPQPQSENGGLPYRTETGPVLLEAWQAMLGQSNVILWGKTSYDQPLPGNDGVVPVDVNVAPFDDFPGPGDTDANSNGVFDGDRYHGGVAGIVAYSSTRAENLARWGAAEDWEPGIAGVRVQLWDETRTRLLNEVTTDSWDESQPTGCQWPNDQPFEYLGVPTDCFDGLRNFNQVRPGVFDGGFAFFTQLEPLVDGEGNIVPIDQRTIERPLSPGTYVLKVIVPSGYQVVKEEDKNVDFGEEYIPQQFLIPGYPLGDGGPPDPAARPRQDNDNLATPFCVGALHTVPDELALFPGIPGTYAGDEIPLCDEKLVTLRYGQNAAQPYFFLFTEAPVAGHVVGFILDDTAAEFDPNSPTFGERYAPPWLPVSISDYTGREIVRTYSDRWGVYSTMVPSSFSANIPNPSGYSPNILQVCVNSPTMQGPDGTPVPDPWHNKSYSQWCFPFQYMPGATTYMDTPVVPTGAFAGQPGMVTLDAELPNLTPVVHSVNGPLDIGPYVVPEAGDLDSRTITLTSAGMVQVPNPEFDQGETPGIPKHITRDYGFGGETGSVLLFSVTGSDIGDLVSLPILSWSDSTITAEVPVGTPTGQLYVLRCLRSPCTNLANLRESIGGVTLTVATPESHAARPPRTVAAGGSIQAAIDAASPGDLVLVAPGTYHELVIMDKPIRLQGWGARSTIINAFKRPTEKLELWRDRVKALLMEHEPLPPDITDPLADIDVSGQTVGSYMLGFQADEYFAMVFKLLHPGRADGAPDPIEEPKLGDALGDLPEELLGVLLGGEGAGVTVFGKHLPIEGVACPPNIARTDDGYGLLDENGQLRPNARVDGFTITGSDGAAGIEVNGNACDFEISNNHMTNNNGYDAAGIKIGHVGVLPMWADEQANNDRAAIHDNLVSQNGSILAHPGIDYLGGGGITIGSGAPGYMVFHNYVAGNFTGGYGAGIGHIGLSTGGWIGFNTVVFNESYNQLVTRSGGGIYVGGRPPHSGELVPDPVGDPRNIFRFPPNLPGPTPGSGHVWIVNNLIQGNQAASGDGGGISLTYVNGRDINPDAVPLEFGDGTEVDDALKVYVWETSNNIMESHGAPWEVNIFGNTIVNNVAGLAGGGVALQDAVHVRLFHNTIAHNDSLAVAGEAFELRAGQNDPFISIPQPAGIVSYSHSLPLRDLLDPGEPTFSNPHIANSIVWENRSFYFAPVEGGVEVPRDPTAPRYGLLANPTSPVWDLGVLGGGAGAALAPTYSVLTDPTGTGPTNVGDPPAFVSAYFNTNRRHAFSFLELKTGIDGAPPLLSPTFDEGGNWVRPMFGPLTLTDPATGELFGDYHLAEGLAGQWLSGAGGLYPSASNVPVSLYLDRDGDRRFNPAFPRSIEPHRGADQVPPPAITVNDVSVTEGNSGTVALEFTVSLSRAAATAITVNYATSNGSARAFVDFVGASGTLTFAPGTTEQTVRVMILGDTRPEADERFFLRLRFTPKQQSQHAKITDAVGEGVILNDDEWPRARRR